MFTIAATSMMLTFGLGEFPCEATRFPNSPAGLTWCQISAYPFVTIMANKPGFHAKRTHLGFYYVSVMQCIYILEKREHSHFRVESCCWDLNFSRTGGWLNIWRLFLWMGSMIGFVSLTQALTDITGPVLGSWYGKDSLTVVSARSLVSSIRKSLSCSPRKDKRSMDFFPQHKQH